MTNLQSVLAVINDSYHESLFPGCVKHSHVEGDSGTRWPSIWGRFCESGSVRDENFYRKLPRGQSGSRRLDFPSQALARSLEPAAGGKLKPSWEILSG